MIELINEVGFVLSFDGRVLEMFSSTGTRIHVRHVKRVKLKERKGKYELSVESLVGQLVMMMKIDPSQRPVIDQLLAALNAARPGEIEFKS